MSKPFYVFKRIDFAIPYAAFNDGFFEGGYALSDEFVGRYTSIPEALHALSAFNFRRRERNQWSSPNDGGNLELVKVTSIAGKAVESRRVLSDCEGCKEGEVVKFGLQWSDEYGGIKDWNESDGQSSCDIRVESARLFATSHEATEYIRLKGNSYQYIRRVAVSTFTVPDTFVETVVE